MSVLEPYQMPSSRRQKEFLEEPYASRLEGLLRFHDLASAEESLRRLDAAWREYLAAGDRAGASHVRAVALKGKARAEQIASNPRVCESKRREKREIAAWFRIWLQTPTIFFDWLALRKQTDEFRRSVAGEPGDS